MSKPTEHPIDLSLWARVKKAPVNERWKWGWNLWDPISDKIYSGEASVQDLVCPVCGEKTLYAYFLAAHYDISGSEAKGRRVYVGDRYFGCHNCQTQVRDRGLIPPWVKDNEVRWGSEWVRKREEERLAQSGFVELSDGDGGKTSK